MNNIRKQIFVVDDDIVNLKAAKNALSGHYDVYALDSGEALLDMLQNIRPALILLDIMMPEMDGHETLKRVKANNRTADIPVVFLTSKSDAVAVTNGISGGASDYIVKPFEPEQLLMRLEAHFNKK